MKKASKFLFISLLFPFIVNGQIVFEKTYGSTGRDYGGAVIQTSDTGYVICGSMNIGDDNDDAILIKTNKFGDTLWTTTYGGIYKDCAIDMQILNDSGYILCGYTNRHGNFSYEWMDLYLVRTNSIGDTLWTKTIKSENSPLADEKGYRVRQTNDNGFVICGFAKKLDNSNIWLVKTDSIGDTLWTRKYPSFPQAYGRGVAQTADGGFIIVGEQFVPPTYNYDAIIIRTNWLGDTLWTRVIEGQYAQKLHSVIVEPNNDIIACGTFSSNTNKVFLLKMDDSGNILWNKLFGSNAEHLIGESIFKTQDGGYIIGGYSSYSGWTLLMKISMAGDLEWYKKYPSVVSGFGACVVQTIGDLGYAIVSQREVVNNDYNILLLKTDSQGLLTNVPGNNLSQIENRIFPNPSTGVFSIEVENNDVSYTILDSKGTLIFSKKMMNNSTSIEKVDLSFLNKGTYYIKVQSRDMIKTSKIIIN